MVSVDTDTRYGQLCTLLTQYWHGGSVGRANAEVTPTNEAMQLCTAHDSRLFIP